MYGSVGMSEENMNEEGIVLLVHNSSPSDEERQQNLEIFRKKFTKSDWAEVERKYSAELRQLKEHKERIWRVQEVKEEWKQIGEGSEAQSYEGHERKWENVGEEKLWKIKEDSDDTKLSGKNFVCGTERLWTKCLYEVRAKRIKESCEKVNLDPVQAMIEIWFRETKNDPKNKLLIPCLEHQITKLAAVLMDQECLENKCTGKNDHRCKYGNNDKMWIEGKDTPMHLVAKENMAMLASQLIVRFPGQLCQRQKKGEKRLPIEVALKEYNDDVAAVMIKNMNNERMRMLFQPDKMTGQTKLRFSDYIQRKEMQKSVIAILDCLMKPDWPFIYEDEDKDDQDGAWSKIADVPIRYHVYFRMLDGDPEGRAPSDDGFDHKAESNFKALLRSPNQAIIIRHPVVRLLADQKWHTYGAKWVRFFSVMYVLFLTSLSIALLSAVASKDPSVYQTGMDYFRMVCEVVTLMGALIYLIMEIDEMIKEKMQYLLYIYHYVDLPGILLLFTIVPLRFYEDTAQWGVAAVAYLINFMRLLKYSPAWPVMAVYSKCLSKMLLNDGSQFAVVYLTVMFAFGGSIFLALKGTNQLSSVGGYGDIILREIRILTGGQSFSSSYKGFNLAIVILILVNMLVVLIMLVNMLIAHLSNVFEEARNEGRIEFSYDKAWMTCKLEQSRFKNFRRDYYTEGAYISDMERLGKIRDDWDTLKAQKNIGNLPSETEKEAIRKVAKKDRYYGVIL